MTASGRRVVRTPPAADLGLGFMVFISKGDMIHGSPLPGWSGRFFDSENMTFARWKISADAQDLHEHHHEQAEVWNIVDGTIVPVVDGSEMELSAGTAAVVPPHAIHSAKIVGLAEVVITDLPRRPDLPGVGST